jgi:protein-S-isoprenylcysteine O-methyltransferase Ste14
MADRADRFRRRLGGLFLGLALAMLGLGQSLLKSHLTGGWFVLYWLVCMVLTCLAMVAALLDVGAIRRRAREQQRDLLGRAVGADAADRPKAPPRGSSY